MNKKLTLSEDTFRLGYYQYRAYVVPSLVIFVSIALFFLVIVPQVQNWFSIQRQIQDTRAKVATLQEDTARLSGVDEGGLDTDLQLTTAALPPDKDLLYILSAINQAGVDAGVAVSDYSLQGGASAAAATTEKDSLDVLISISGGSDSAQKFITEVKKRLPLANIAGVRVSSTTSTSVQVSFFSQPFAHLSFDADQPIETISPIEQGLLTELSSFNKGNDGLLDTSSIPVPSVSSPSQ